MTSWKSVSPATTGEISDYHVLTVRHILVRLGAIAGIKTHLKNKGNGNESNKNTTFKRIKGSKPSKISKNSTKSWEKCENAVSWQINTYKCRNAAFSMSGVASGLGVGGPINHTIIENGVGVHFVSG